jgi:thiamine pyrophosphate-dependent acetolactate synthase large subunit-like protein
MPGDGINGIMEALRKRTDKIRFIQVRHEEAAAFMACAYAKYTGKLARNFVLLKYQENSPGAIEVRQKLTDSFCRPERCYTNPCPI